jgi:hypothetical protein
MVGCAAGVLAGDVCDDWCPRATGSGIYCEAVEVRRGDGKFDDAAAEGVGVTPGAPSGVRAGSSQAAVDGVSVAVAHHPAPLCGMHAFDQVAGEQGGQVVPARQLGGLVVLADQSGQLQPQLGDGLTAGRRLPRSWPCRLPRR